MPYQHPSLKQRLYPTLQEIQAAVRSADDQEPRGRDIRPLLAILERISIASPRIAGHILTRRTGLLSYRCIITEDGEVTERASDAQRLLNKLIGAVLHYSIDTPLFGHSVMEILWTVGDQKTVPKLLRKFRPYEIDVRGESVYILETDGNGKLTETLIPAELLPKFIISIDESTWTGGTLRSIMYNAILTNETIQEWANFNRKLKGLIQAKAPEEEKADAGNAAANFVNNQFAVTSKEVEFILNELTSSRGVDSFSAFKSVLENDIAVAILGQANTAELPAGGGSRAALQVLNLIRADIHFSDMERAKRLINEQLLPSYWSFNVQKDVECPLTFDFVFDESIDTESSARMFQQVSSLGLPVIKSELYSKLGLTVPSDTDETFILERGGF